MLAQASDFLKSELRRRWNERFEVADSIEKRPAFSIMAAIYRSPITFVLATCVVTKCCINIRPRFVFRLLLLLRFYLWYSRLQRDHTDDENVVSKAEESRRKF